MRDQRATGPSAVANGPNPVAIPPDRTRASRRGFAGPRFGVETRDHCPLDDQSGKYKRERMDLNRSTLANRVGRSTALLEPLADAIVRHFRNFCGRHTPETAGKGQMRHRAHLDLCSQRGAIGRH
ncbi:MAG: transposase [Pseudomonadota bacterium]